MKIVIISDTHRYHKNIDLPAGDILIHAGDLSGSGTVSQLEDINEWFGTLGFSHIICVPGNHDRLFEWNLNVAREIMTNCTILLDEEIIINGLKFYGSPWQPRFFNWAFNLSRGRELTAVWAKIPEDTDVLITHCPPYAINDSNINGEHCGCYDLLERVNQIKPKLHCFGHIHEGYGKNEFNGITFINASVCNAAYNPINKPHVISIKK